LIKIGFYSDLHSVHANADGVNSCYRSEQTAQLVFLARNP
jgi:hypothetical protein